VVPELLDFIILLLLESEKTPITICNAVLLAIRNTVLYNLVLVKVLFVCENMVDSIGTLNDIMFLFINTKEKN
jgi:hypothetical protein